MTEPITISDQDDKYCLRCHHSRLINQLNIRCDHPALIDHDPIYGPQPRHVRSARQMCNGKYFQPQRPCWLCRVVGLSILFAFPVYLLFEAIREIFG